MRMLDDDERDSSYVPSSKVVCFFCSTCGSIKEETTKFLYSFDNSSLNPSEVKHDIHIYVPSGQGA